MSQRDLERWVGPDPTLSSEAFERLSEKARPVISAFLNRYPCSHEEREDIIADTLLKVANARSRFRPEGEAAWRQYLRSVALNCLRDEFRKRPGAREVPLDNLGEIPFEDRPYIDALLEHAEDRRRLYAEADACWLGQSDEEGDRRLLAAQLHGDGIPAETIARLLGASSLDDALTDPVVVRRFAFHRLYFSNDRLSCHVLGIEAKSLNATAERANRGTDLPPPEGWTWSEVQVVLLRVRNGLLTKQIDRFTRHGLSTNEVLTVIERSLTLYPMAGEAQRLCVELPNTAPLAKDALWKRLAFQYYCADRLPQLQIHERTSPAAEVLGYRLTEPVIAGWISVGRLFTALAAHVEQRRCL